MDHAPLPWRRMANPRVYTSAGIVAEDGSWIMPVNVGSRKDVDFIVQACNSHYELIDTCKKAASGLVSEIRIKNPDGHDLALTFIKTRLESVVVEATKTPQRSSQDELIAACEYELQFAHINFKARERLRSAVVRAKEESK